MIVVSAVKRSSREREREDSSSPIVNCNDNNNCVDPRVNERGKRNSRRGSCFGSFDGTKKKFLSSPFEIREKIKHDDPRPTDRETIITLITGQVSR